MSGLEIDSSLWPIPDSQYAKEGPLVRKWALSILAFHLDILMSPGNQLTGGLRGDYFFADSEVPLPRPATFLAWQKLVRLGHGLSATFVPPFLPSLREEDEVGQAIAKRGTHVVSLSRRSSAHFRDSQGRIRWGKIYFGNLEVRNPTKDSVLTGATNRSNIVEAVVCPQRDQHPDSAQNSIRERYEFLAIHGIASTKQLPFIPGVHRLLFRFLSHDAVADWALCYVETHRLVMADPESIDSDFKQLIHEWLENSQNRNDEAIEKAVKNSSRFGDISGLNF